MREIRSPLDGILSPFAARAGVTAFSPSSLFASGEDGAWYDPSDTTSLYQARNGGDYADIDGDVVGIMLDKSQMGSSNAAAFIAAQPELVTNGTFDTDTDWTKGGSATISAGVANFTGTADEIYQQPGFNDSLYHSLTFTATGTGTMYFRLGEIAVNVDFISASGTYTFVIKPTSNAGYIVFRSFGFVGTIDNVSVKEIPGNHAIAPSDAARSLYKTAGGLHWLEFDGVDDYWEASVSGLGATSASATAFEAVDTVGVIHAGDTSGKYYDIYQDGSTSTSLRSGAGSPTSRVNGAAYSGTTRDDLHTAVAGGSPVILTYESLDLSSWTKFGFGNYEQYSVGRSVEGDMYGCVLLDRALTTDERSDLEAYLAAKSGVTL